VAIGVVFLLVALVFVSAASGREFKVVEVLLLTVVLTAASAGWAARSRSPSGFGRSSPARSSVRAMSKNSL
jgi:hypothetical protein